EHRPVMLHRAILGSLERFIGVYLEHTAGHLPPWLAPVQVLILNITDRVNVFCEELQKMFKDNQVRVEFDNRNEQLKFKIREAQLQKVPYMVIVGDNEAASRTVSLRLRDGSEHKGIGVDDLMKLITKDIKERKLQPSLMKS
ncbi:MAG: His/Gly/Thr/Pro-type tRNA ligase C-terminal domain-containing protein, partial [Pseudobdellovibrionaceae bacterium]